MVKKILHVGVNGGSTPTVVRAIQEFNRHFEVMDILDPLASDVTTADMILFDWQRQSTIKELQIHGKLVGIYAANEPYEKLRQILAEVAPHESDPRNLPCIVTGEHLGIMGMFLLGNHVLEALMIKCHLDEARWLRYYM